MATDKVIGNYTAKINVTEQQVEDIMVGAIEGGINHWAGLLRDDLWKDKPSNEPISMWASKLLLEGYGMSFYDREDGEVELFRLNIDKLLCGIEMNANQRPHDCDLEQADAETYDCIIQFALFGEIIYG